MTDVNEILLGLDPLNPADGFSDLDGDGLSLAWEFTLGTNASLADTDADGWSDSAELLTHSTDPLDWLSFPFSSASSSGGAPSPVSAAVPASVPPPPSPPPPSLENGEFSMVNFTNWINALSSKSYQNGGFKWGAGAIGAWTAYVGETIEVWEVGSERFIELDGSPGNYGAKQPIKNVRPGGYVLTWKQCGRTHSSAGSDPYKVRVYYMNGSTPVDITLSPLYAGFDKTKWTDNALSFRISSEQLTAAGNDNPIYIAFIPLGSMNSYGTLIDKVSLLPVDVAVDADRDGEITFDGKDKTTAEKPFRFWINDDDDDVDGNGGTYDHIPVVEPDHQNNRIDYFRDLEDLAQLSFGLYAFWDKIKSGDIKVGFKWSDTSDGNPSINIFRQVDQSGGPARYFVDEDEAITQSSSSIFGETNASKVITVSGTAVTYFPQSFINKLPAAPAPTYLLVEGAAKGKGKLNLVLKIDGQEVVCEGPWIKLMDVRQFYTRGRTSLTATQISDPWDNPNPPVITSVPDNSPEFIADPDEKEQCIVHVHGWRMTEGDSRNWSEMTFKRLWQLHYKGRFATFRWATFSDDTHPPILGVPQSILTYNRSEYRSWLCSSALAQFVNSLPYQGARYLIAHSMGNVITGKALQDGMNINRYAMCNAAMAAMSYDGSITNAPLDLASTPDTDSDPATAAFGLKNRFSDSLTTRINYYLPDDDALQSWIANQIVNKPEEFDGPYGHYYSYESWYPSGQKIRHVDPSFLSGDTTRIVTSLTEAMGHVVKSRSHAVGATGYANGSITSKVGLDSFGFEDEHSAEWNWSLTGSYRFWRRLFDSFDITTTAPQ